MNRQSTEGIVKRLLGDILNDISVDNEKCSEGARRRRAAQSAERRRQEDQPNDPPVREVERARTPQPPSTPPEPRDLTGSGAIMRRAAIRTSAEHDKALAELDAASEAFRVIHANHSVTGGPGTTSDRELVDAHDRLEAATQRVSETLERNRLAQEGAKTEQEEADANRPRNPVTPPAPTENHVPTLEEFQRVHPGVSVSPEVYANWDKVLGKSSPAEVFKFLDTLKDAGHTITKLEIKSNFRGVLAFQLQTSHPDGVRAIADGTATGSDYRRPGVTMSREFYRTSTGYNDNKANEVEHSFFAINSAIRDNGVGMKILSELLPVYEKNGYTSINVHANIDVGGYVWARCGFQLDDAKRRREFFGAVDNNASDLGLTSYLRGIDRNSPDAARIISNLVMKDSNGKVMMEPLLDNRTKEPLKDASGNVRMGPVSVGKMLLLGSNWYGRIDLTDPVQRKQYHDYINKVGR